MNYDTEIEQSKNNMIVELADIYDFRDTPNQDLFEGIYDFCRENLDIHLERGSIGKSIFLFKNSFIINAKAGFINNQNVILINLGLVKHCIDTYLENQKLNLYVENKFSDLAKKLDNPISMLGFQITTQFTYYHELAHLFQFSKKANNMELQERSNDEKGFSILIHKLEINADTYASISIATHIQQYIDKIFGKEMTEKIAIDIIKILGACLLNYIINFSDNTKLYFDKNSHPHPFLRFLNIILNISNHIESMPFFKSQNINLDGSQLFKKIIDFYEELEGEGVFKTNFSDLVYQNKDFQNDIVTYLYELLNFDNSEYENAMDVWNKHVV